MPVCGRSRLFPRLSQGFAVLALSMMSACSGGGASSSASSVALQSCPSGSLSVTAAARSPLSASPLPSSSPSLATYTLTSHPTGLTVTVNGSARGTTPMTLTPSSTTSATVVTIGTAPTSMTYCVAQTAGSSRTLFYNAIADSSGSIGSIASQSLAHAPFPATAMSRSILRRHLARHLPAIVYSPTQLVVTYRTAAFSTTSNTVLQLESLTGVRHARGLGPQEGETFRRVLAWNPGTDLQAIRQRLLTESGVVGVERVQMRYPLSAAVMPNDAYFTQLYQWPLFRIDAPDAWGLTTGDPTITIAVIDTGYDEQAPELTSKVVYAERVIDGVVTVDPPSAPNGAAQDTDGHGTNVSGIAAAATNNGSEIAGVGYNVKLQEYDIFTPTTSTNAGAATTADEAQAVYDAVAQGARIISISLGGPESGGIDTTEYEAIEYALAHGVTVVAASGNESAPTVDYPAAYPGVISVGASALNDRSAPQQYSTASEYVASYSNTGPGLTLVAPGGDPSSTADDDPLHWILSIDSLTAIGENACTGETEANCLLYFAGTSEAVPQVAGTAALMLSQNGTLTPSQIASILQATSDNINDAHQGHGRLNAYRAVAAATGTPANLPTQLPNPAYLNFRAFAYNTSGVATPVILNVTFPQGVPVNADGTFRLPDIPANAGSYRIAVWADLNGDGIIDAGDEIGVSSTCIATAPCTSAQNLTVQNVATGYTLP